MQTWANVVNPLPTNFTSSIVLEREIYINTNALAYVCFSDAKTGWQNWHENNLCTWRWFIFVVGTKLFWYWMTCRQCMSIKEIHCYFQLLLSYLPGETVVHLLNEFVSFPLLFPLFLTGFYFYVLFITIVVWFKFKAGWLHQPKIHVFK